MKLLSKAALAATAAGAILLAVAGTSATAADPSTTATPSTQPPPQTRIISKNSKMTWDPETAAKHKLADPTPTSTAGTRVKTAHVTFDLLDRNGQIPAEERWVTLYDLDSENFYKVAVVRGRAEGDVPVGRYFVGTFITSKGTGGTLVIEPEVKVGAAVTKTLDARAGQPLGISLDRSGAERQAAHVIVAAPVAGRLSGLFGFKSEGSFLTPTGKHPGLVVRHTAVLGGDKPGADIFNIVETYRDRVPANLQAQVRTSSLAKVKTSYAAQGAAACGYRWAAADWPYDPIVSFGSATGELPTSRNEYFTPGYDWHLDSSTQSCDNDASQHTNYLTDSFPRAGSYQRSRDLGPYGPGLADSNHRFNDELALYGVFPASGTPETYGETLGDGVTNSATLSRDGKVIAEETAGAGLSAAVGPEAAQYEFTVKTKRDVPWTRLFTEQTATWRFTSKHASGDGERLPFLAVRYQTALNNQNLAARTHLLKATIQRLDGGPTGIRPALQASFDDGKTWTTVKVGKVGDSWAAPIKSPPTATHVSLRATATDQAGNSVTQTTIRSYALG